MFISVSHACAKKVINKMEIRNLLQNFSIQDITTGQVSEEFETPYTSQYKFGGEVSVSRGFNTEFLDLVADHIKDHTDHFLESEFFYDSYLTQPSVILESNC